MRTNKGKSVCGLALLALIVTVPAGSGAYAQKTAPKKAAAKPKTVQTQNDNELSKLRDSYIKATKEYKASLEKLLALYQATARKTEERLKQTKKL